MRTLHLKRAAKTAATVCYISGTTSQFASRDSSSGETLPAGELLAQADSNQFYRIGLDVAGPLPTPEL